MNLSLVETMPWMDCNGRSEREEVVDAVVADANRGMSGLVSQALPQSISCQVPDAFAFEPEHQLLRLVEGDVDAQS
jgi:phage tail protein X